MAAIPPQKPQILDHQQPDAPDLSQGCRMPIPEQDGPTILTTPQDEEPKRENPGCGSTDPIQLPTHTNGCGENVQTPEEKREQLILHAEIGDLSDVDVKFREDNIKHIFDDRVGHVVDTPENRKRFIGLVKDFDNYDGDSKWSNSWYGKTLPDGTQLWAEVRDGIIRNCGINDKPHEYNPETGYSKPVKPEQK